MYTRIYGLTGSSLSHSFSKKYFDQKFRKEKISDAVYKNFELSSISKFPDFILSQPDLCGLNVTSPYKEAIIPFLDGLEDEAKIIGAVNCVQVKRGKRIGHNTDVAGFRESLKPLLKSHHQKALVLGTGGAAKAVSYVLSELGINFKYVSVQPQNDEFSYSQLNKEILDEYNVVVNASPVGMIPHEYLTPPIPHQFLSSGHLLFDLIYNPAETIFLQKGKQQGATIKNGEEMLKIQAEKSWEIWNS